MDAFDRVCSTEDLVHQDVNGYSENLVASFYGPHSRSSSHNTCICNVEGCSLCSKYPVGNTTPGIHRRKGLEVREELLVNTRYEIIRTNYSYQGVSFIIRGYASVPLNFSVLRLLKSGRFDQRKYKPKLSLFIHIFNLKIYFPPLFLRWPNMYLFELDVWFFFFLHFLHFYYFLLLVCWNRIWNYLFHGHVNVNSLIHKVESNVGHWLG